MIDANFIKAKISEINKNLLNAPPRPELNKVSLLGGQPGITLYLALIYQYKNDENIKQQIKADIYNSLSAIGESEAVLATHCNGICGWAWLLKFLKDSNITFEFDEYISEVEEAIESAVIDFLNTGEFDILHGAMGLGIFLMENDNHTLVIRILEALDKTCQKSENEYKWMRHDKYVAMTDIYDFGLAHGNTAIIYFLTKCYNKNIFPELCRRLIEENIKFFLNNAQDIEQVKAFFPTSIRVDNYSETKDAGSYSRLAWCYGDMGILYTLFNAAVTLKDEKLIDRFTKMLHRLTKRKDYDHTMITDAGLCHGSSGIGYMYLKLYEKTNDVVFKEAFEYWLLKTINLGNNENGIAGYLFDMGEYGGMRIQYDFLTGVTGVGAFLISALNHIEKRPEVTSWDRCMFLS